MVDILIAVRPSTYDAVISRHIRRESWVIFIY